MNRIGILAGGGRLPLMIAESVAARGDAVHIVAIKGEADPEIVRFPHTWVNWGEIGRMVSTLRSEAGELVIAGGVRRPDLWKVRPDSGFFTHLPQLFALLAGGDDAVLSRVVRFFEQKGLRVRGAHEVAPDLLAAAGRLGAVALSDQGHVDARIGFSVRRVLGRLDAGQAVVVSDGKVLAIEGAEGTDAMLGRVALLAGRDSAAARRGVLAKGPKPGQELRIDMPAIGPNTVASAAAAGLAGIVVEAGSVLILDREQALRAADQAACAVVGLAGTGAPAAGAASGYGTPRAARVVGRLAPARRDARDLEKGLAVVECLAPFATGTAAVVARAYVLAIEAGEGAAAMLERVRGLRQWGEGRIGRRLGVLVCRVSGSSTGPAPAALLEQAKAQGLAGVAVTGQIAALEPYAEAARLADDAGLFLVTCEAARG
jgi:UDP-2,3-diacylglucosamine hydrolase